MSSKQVLFDLAFYLHKGEIAMHTDDSGRVFVKDSTGRLLVHIGQAQIAADAEEDATRGESDEK